MSSPITRTRLGRRIVLAASVAVAAAAGGAVAVPSAQAAFTLQKCQGSNVKGQGGSFQRNAQASFGQLFAGSLGCDGTPTIETYTANGSGNGLAAMGAGGGNAQLLCFVAATCTGNPAPAGQRDPNTPFVTSDDPPSTTQLAAINSGTTSASDDGKIHIIPAALGAATVIVHLPEGCSVGTDVTGNNDGTGNSAANNTIRPLVPTAKIEQAFAGQIQTWGDLVNGISGTPTSTQEAGIGDCASVPVKRIVRQDVSGTTFAFKNYLNLANAQRGWTTTYNTPNNLSWPKAGGTGTATPTQIDPASATKFCANTAADRLCSGNASGAGALGALVVATDGSIGYSDLATSRADFSITPTSSSNPNRDYTFWLPLQNNPGGTATRYVEPTADASGNLSTTPATTRGAACSNVTVQNAPTTPTDDPTLGDWSKAFAAGGAGYPNCVISYVLAWDDDAAVYGTTATEESRARTVKDYVTLITSDAGQATLSANDYSAVGNSQNLRTVAQKGAAAIDWNKTGGGGGTPPPTDTTPNTTPPPADTTPVDDTPPADTTTDESPAPQPTTTTTTPVPVPVPVPVPTPVATTPVATTTPTTTATTSSVFTLGSARATSKGSKLSLTATFPGAGKASVRATARIGGKTVTVGKASKSVSKSGKTTISIKLTSRARSAVRRAGKKGLTTTVRVAFQPSGASSSTVKSVRVRVRR